MVANIKMLTFGQSDLNFQKTLAFPLAHRELMETIKSLTVKLFTARNVPLARRISTWNAVSLMRSNSYTRSTVPFSVSLRGTQSNTSPHPRVRLSQSNIRGMSHKRGRPFYSIE